MALDAPVSPLRVLVVEDYEPFLQHVSSTLRQHSSLEVIGEVQNGIEAVEFAAALQPDLILLDIGLPSFEWNRCSLPYSRVGTERENRLPDSGILS